MRSKHLLAATVAVAFALASCTTPKNISYFQDVETGTVVTPTPEKLIRLKPDDKVSILVTASDLAIAQTFNLVSASNRVGSTTSSTKFTGGTNTTYSSGQTSYYTIDPQGDINFPVLGTLHVAGLTRHELAKFIEQKLIKDNLLKDPIVIVEFANTGISILGEVGTPGRYEFNKNQLTIIDAIAMAGDLRINGRRDEILVMRKNAQGQQEGYRIDLTDLQNLAQSPIYYLQQDDIIYVQPNNKLKRETTPNGNTPYTPSFWIGLGSSILSLSTLIITLATR